MKQILKTFFLVGVLLSGLLIGISVEAQQASFRVTQNSLEAFAFDFQLGTVELQPTAEGRVELKAEGMPYTTTAVGLPQLPVWNQMIVVPEGAIAVISLQTDESKVVSSADLGFRLPLKTVGLPQMKGGTTVGNVTDFSGTSTPLVAVIPVGTMRGVRLARLTLCPFEYDSVRGQLTIHHHVVACVTFVQADAAGTLAKWHRYASPFFGALLPESSAKNQYLNELDYGSTPPRYTIVSRPEFRKALQPLVAWKRQQGMEVEQLYVDSYRRDTVRRYLQSVYDSADVLHPAPTFILLVGDIDQIQSYTGQHHIPGMSGHVTDLYYADFTGDVLPDALLGRISVVDTAQLHAVVDKIIRYEQFRLADSTYLDRALILAGNEADSIAPVVSNGQVNYLSSMFRYACPELLLDSFFNPAIDTLTDSWIRTRHDSIMAIWSRGVGVINYSGHGHYTGWRSPRVNLSDVDSLPSDGKYVFIVNNCCQTGDFAAMCFAERLLQKPDGGAIGVIGATNQTLWLEDYRWAVGSKIMALQPEYDSLSLGAFDRLLHAHQEPAASHARTAGQLLLAGNYAVTQSGSPYSGFYWEVYQLQGDPSLMPYLGQPQSQWISVDDPVVVGTSYLAISGTPGAFVAVVQDSSLLAVCTINSQGRGELALSAPITDSLVTITATQQYHRPVLDTMAVIGYQRPVAIVSQNLMDFKLYPNPANDHITIELGSVGEDCVVDIMDVSGRKVATFFAKSHAVTQYSTNNLRFGIFVVAVRNSNFTAIQRLIIAR